MGSWPATAAGGICLIAATPAAMSFFAASSWRRVGLGPVHFAIFLGFGVLLLHLGRYRWMGVAGAATGGAVMMAKPLLFPIMHERGPFTLTSETHLYYVVPAMFAGFVALGLALGPRPQPRDTGPVPALVAVVVLSGLAGGFALMQFFGGRGSPYSVLTLLVPGLLLVILAIVVATRGSAVAAPASAWPTAGPSWSPSAWSSLGESSAPLHLSYVDPSMDALLAAVAEAPSPLGVENLVGRRFGPYEVMAWLGQGGMGQVYRTRDHRLLRDVALKLLPAGRDDAGRRARLLQEARAAAQLNHPHVAQIYDVSVDGPRPYIVMELCEGQTLRDRLKAGPCTSAEADLVAGQIASALAAAHARGIVHRDLKPENVMVDPQGRVKVLDFGLARVEPGAPTTSLWGPGLTQDGAIVGTPAYMSPEQARGGPVDARTDVFAFGLVLHEMLTGRLPERASSGLEVGALPDPWLRLVGASLAALPDERPRDGQALLGAWPQRSQ